MKIRSLRLVLLLILTLSGVAQAADRSVMSKKFMKELCSYLTQDGWGGQALEVLTTLEDRYGSCKKCKKLNRKFGFACRSVLKKLKKQEKPLPPKRLEPNVELIQFFLLRLRDSEVGLAKEEQVVLNAFLASCSSARDVYRKSYFGTLDKYWAKAIQVASEKNKAQEAVK